MTNVEQGGAGAIRQDSLVDRLVQHPGVGGDCRVELGFLGRSHREGYWCLYRGPELGDHLEVRESDIVHSQSLESDSNPLGGTLVWLSSDAVVRSVRTGPAPSQGDFLQGAVMDEFLRATGVNSLTAGGPYGIWTIATSTPCAIGTIIIIVVSAVKCDDVKRK